MRILKLLTLLGLAGVLVTHSVASQGPNADSNAPGAFTGGPTITPQHGSWVGSDTPDKYEKTGPTPTTGTSSGGSTINGNVRKSMSQDMQMLLQTQRQQQAGGSRRLTEEGLGGEGQEAKEYEAASFQLSPEAAAAATAEVASLEKAVLARRAQSRALQGVEGAGNGYSTPDVIPGAHPGEVTVGDETISSGWVPPNTPKFGALPKKGGVAPAPQPIAVPLTLVGNGQAGSAIPASDRVVVEPKDVPSVSQGTSSKPTSGGGSRKHARRLTELPPGQSRAGEGGVVTPEAEEEPVVLPVGAGGKPLYGVTYSWRRAEDCNGSQRQCMCPHPDDLEQDLNLLHRYSHRVRTFSMECPELLRMLAHYTTSLSPGSSWLLGVWLGRDATANEQQLKRLGDLLEVYPRLPVYGISIGNEALTRKDLNQQELIGYIRKVRALLVSTARSTSTPSLADIPLTTTDQPSVFTPSLTAELDFVSVALNPFYSEHVDPTQSGWASNIVTGLRNHYSQLAAKHSPKPVLIAEVGWPTQSGQVDSNPGSTQMARAFLKEWTTAAAQAELAYFYHELTDATWKTTLRLPSLATLSHSVQTQTQVPAPEDVLGEEHFGLVSGDRLLDKELLGDGMGCELPRVTRGERGALLNKRGDSHTQTREQGRGEGGAARAEPELNGQQGIAVPLST